MPSGGRRAPRRTLKRLALAAVLLVAAPLCIGATQYAMDGAVVSPTNLFCLPAFRDRNRAQPVTVGVLAPFDQSFGQRQIWGVGKFLRDNGGTLGFKVQLDVRDTSKGLDELGGILSDFEAKKIDAVIGPMKSRLAYDAKIWAHAHRKPVLSPLASASYLVRPGEDDFFFRLGMSDTVRAKALFEWLKAKNLQNDPYILNEWADAKPGEPEIYGHSQSTAIKRYIDRATTLRFTRGDAESARRAVEQVRNDGRAVLIFGYTSDVKRILTDMEEMGLDNDVFLMGVILEEIEKLHLRRPERLHVVSNVNSEARSLENSDRLRRMFEDDNPGLEYDLSAYYAYDTMDILAEAIGRARARTCDGHIEGAALANELRHTPNRRRMVINGGFLADRQEVYFESDGFMLVDGRFRPVGIGM